MPLLESLEEVLTTLLPMELDFPKTPGSSGSESCEYSFSALTKPCLIAIM